jgi:hypothetical protein
VPLPKEIASRDFFIFSQTANMKQFITGLCFFIAIPVAAQPGNFPKAWEGNWKGELQWYRTGKAEPQKVNMELRIHPTDSAAWTWQIIYGKETEDNRPYQLLQKDTAGVHWVIDEKNGIVLDQYWVANRFCGAFTVMNNTILNSYWMEKDKLMIEFFSLGAKPVTTSGKGTEESPSVDSYRIGSYQKVILKRR